MSKRSNIAPEHCMGCRKPYPPLAKRTRQSGWIYVAGTDPPGAMCCSMQCVEKFARSQRK